MPVYEPSPPGHSTHVYGASVPYVQGAIFRWTGVNNVSGRLLSLFSALSTVVLIAICLRGDRSAWYLGIACALLLGVNFRSWEYFAENRPDMPALWFATLGVVLTSRGQETRRVGWVALGSACLVAGFFFKQTAFIFTAVPLVALVLRFRWPARSEVWLALIPPLTAVATVVGLKWGNPTVYHYMIEVPKAFGLRWPAAARDGWELLLDSPLFLLLVGEWIMFERGSLRRDPRVLWVAAALVVAIPFSAVTTAKVGGAPNSLLPALFAMMAFCVLRLPRLLRFVEGSGSGWSSRLAAGSFLALMILLTAFPRLSNRHGLITPESKHQEAYWPLVQLVETLPGSVVCPEDPTIPFYGKNYVGYNIFMEYDTHLANGVYADHPPDWVLKEVETADYLVDVYDTTQDLIKPSMLRSQGFEPVAIEGMTLETSGYQLWRRGGRPEPERLTAHTVR